MHEIFLQTIFSRYLVSGGSGIESKTECHEKYRVQCQSGWVLIDGGAKMDELSRWGIKSRLI